MWFSSFWGKFFLNFHVREFPKLTNIPYFPSTEIKGNRLPESWGTEKVASQAVRKRTCWISCPKGGFITVTVTFRGRFFLNYTYKLIQMCVLTSVWTLAESGGWGPGSRSGQAAGAGGRATETGRAAGASARAAAAQRLWGDDPQTGAGEGAPAHRAGVQRPGDTCLSPRHPGARRTRTSTGLIFTTDAPRRNPKPHLSNSRPPSVWPLTEA